MQVLYFMCSSLLVLCPNLLLWKIPKMHRNRTRSFNSCKLYFMCALPAPDYCEARPRHQISPPQTCQCVSLKGDQAPFVDSSWGDLVLSHCVPFWWSRTPNGSSVRGRGRGGGGAFPTMHRVPIAPDSTRGQTEEGESELDGTWFEFHFSAVT